MGYRDLVQRMSETAIKLTGDLRVEGHFFRTTTEVYNVENDAVGLITQGPPYSGVLVRLKDDEDDGAVVPSDTQKLIVPLLKLRTLHNFIPRITDAVTLDLLVGSPQWQIVRVEEAPGQSVMIMTIRAPKSIV